VPTISIEFRADRIKKNISSIIDSGMEYIDGTPEGYEQALNSIDMVGTVDGLSIDQSDSIKKEAFGRAKKRHLKLYATNYPEAYVEDFRIPNDNVVNNTIYNLTFELEGTSFVKDDGNGYPIELVEQFNRGFQITGEFQEDFEKLESIKSSLQKIDSKLEIHSKERSGTTVNIHLKN
jgi:hypothetical protein